MNLDVKNRLSAEDALNHNWIIKNTIFEEED